ncbi:hypothetical protein AURDEDRAFT_179022 [Auricularia subglabra TFB-10046 SS5]|nr:hypothetical protein AURDEDRAFT_179022 [Auricularia subglabra TFB-10046 SS5]
MPKAHSSLKASDLSQVFIVTKNDTSRNATLLQRRPGEVYVHYANTDKRLDEWVPEAAVRPAEPHEVEQPVLRGRKRKRAGSVPPHAFATSTRAQSVAPNGAPYSIDAPDDELEPGPADAYAGQDADSDDSDVNEHRLITSKRNFDKVIYGQYIMRTWYFSPYPITETEHAQAHPQHNGKDHSVSDAAPPSPPRSASASGSRRPSGVVRTTLRAHGRTADIVAGGLGRDNVQGETTMWVCERCFSYAPDGASLEFHLRSCNMDHPPGRKVYERGAHTIWEVDGAEQKLYCQNLSLFGKLFIDVKTSFFNTEGFMFYMMTEADSKRDHVLGYFSKEKVSYDDYNLACIVVLPPFQRKGYGMLLIEFSYELSRREGKIGTPERPLSDLGLRSYLSYWAAVLIRFFRRLLVVNVAESSSLLNEIAPLPMAADQRKPKKQKLGGDAADCTPDYDEDLLASMRTLHTQLNSDGSVTIHVSIHAQLTDIANAVKLPLQDVAFAMRECGFLDHRKVELAEDGETEEDVIVLSREMVEAAAEARNIKKMFLQPSSVLL